MEQSPTSHLKLLALPLFQGITQQELHKLAAHARFHFQKLNSGITFIKEGEACKDLFFLLQGKIEITTSAANNSFMVKDLLYSQNDCLGLVLGSRLHTQRKRKAVF